MKVYLDSSSLFKLYHNEKGASVLLQWLENQGVSIIFLSRVSRLEFESTVWKKVRTRELTEVEALGLIEIFRNDYPRYHWIEIDQETEMYALDFLNKYGPAGLRTLDSLHMASAQKVSRICNFFLTEDKLLGRFFESENLVVPTLDPPQF